LQQHGFGLLRSDEWVNRLLLYNNVIPNATGYRLVPRVENLRGSHGPRPLSKIEALWHNSTRPTILLYGQRS